MKTEVAPIAIALKTIFIFWFAAGAEALFISEFEFVNQEEPVRPILRVVIFAEIVPVRDPGTYASLLALWG